MPEQKKKASRRHPAPLYVAVVHLYDPDDHRGNERLIVEGPFTDHALAIQTLTAFVKSKRFSTASTRVICVNDRGKFRRMINDIRKLLK